MRKTRCLALAAAVGTFLCVTGCKHYAESPVERVSSQLNAGGCYYEVYDCTKLPPQLDFLFARVRPAVEPLYAQFEFPLSLDELLAKVKEICQKAGFNRIEACGQSSMVLYGSPDKLPYFFHNRAVVDTGSAPDVPAFLMPLAGKPVALETFAAAVPGNAVCAFTLNFDWGGLYRWINQNWPLPPTVIGALQGFTGCPPEEFFSGISGRVTGIYLDTNPRRLKVSVQMPDQANRLYALIAKVTMQDASSGEISIPLPDNLKQNGQDFGDVKLVKGGNVLTFYVGNGTKELIEKELADGKTFAKRADFAKLTARIPVTATGYGIGDYSSMNPFDKPEIVTDNAHYAEVAAYQVSAAGCIWYTNGYTDCQGMFIKGFMSIIPQLQPLLNAFRSNSCNDCEEEPVIEDTEENRAKCIVNLTAIYEVAKVYQTKHDGKLPEAMGLAGLREIVREAPETLSPVILYCPSDWGTVTAEKFDNLKWLNTSYVYVGALPESIPAAVRPLFTEVPRGCHEGNTLNILFADGHTEHVTLADNVDSMEKLMSFLHTEKHYAEDALKVLMERGKALDEMLSKELAEEWQVISQDLK